MALYRLVCHIQAALTQDTLIFCHVELLQLNATHVHVEHEFILTMFDLF